MRFFLSKVGQQNKKITTTTSHTSYFLINFPAKSQPFLLDLTLIHYSDELGGSSSLQPLPKEIYFGIIINAGFFQSHTEML